MNHHFDISNEASSLDLFAEELPQQVQLLSDCLSSIATAGCGISSVGSIISSGSSSSVQ